jgi:hypothetical protein
MSLLKNETMENKDLYEKGFMDGFKIGAYVGCVTSIVTFAILWYLTH